MDWLVKHKVTIDCEKKLITFSISKGERVELKGNGYQKIHWLYSLPTYSGGETSKF